MSSTLTGGRVAARSACFENNVLRSADFPFSSDLPLVNRRVLLFSGLVLGLLVVDFALELFNEYDGSGFRVGLEGWLETRQDDFRVGVGDTRVARDAVVSDGFFLSGEGTR
jgi:hypothetical protein